MRHIILKDKKILQRDYDRWKHQDILFWQENLGITPTYDVAETDYSTYPTYIDQDQDIRPTTKYLQSLTTPLVKKYGEFGMDFIMVMIHEDNWRSHGPLWEQIKRENGIIKEKGIWGTNYSYIFGKQCLAYSRWDGDNATNTFGTAYHERHHSFDAIIKVELGIDVQPLLGVTKYDHEVTHGNKAPWKYIRNKENLESLKIMKPHLLKAFQARKDKHEEVTKGLMEIIIKLATQVLYLIRANQNKKNGVSNKI